MPTVQPGASGYSRQGEITTGLRCKKKNSLRIFFVRGLLITSLVTGTLVFCYTALLNISHPYILGAQQSAEIAEKTQEIKTIAAENSQLTKQSAFLVRPDGIEYEARLKGYLKPGERSLVLTTPAATVPQ
jgi:cell division protein FtsB